jgi:hypothetical protein
MIKCSHDYRSSIAAGVQYYRSGRRKLLVMDGNRTETLVRFMAGITYLALVRLEVNTLQPAIYR